MRPSPPTLSNSPADSPSSEARHRPEDVPLLRLLLVASAILLSVVLGLASAARADDIGTPFDADDEHLHAIELGLGFSHSDSDDFDFEITNIRYSRFLRGPWHLEATATADFGDLGDGDRYLDFSARHTFRDSDRWQLFALGGIGAGFFDGVSFDGRDDQGFRRFTTGGTDARGSAHVGLGFAWKFHDRGYLRTDFLHRELFDKPDLVFTDRFSSSIDIGWRF